jgi:hypothetical protein
MPNLEDAIRERAYHLWIADGQPEGKRRNLLKGQGSCGQKKPKLALRSHASYVAQDRTTPL